MTFMVDATYENGTLKLARPLPLQEKERVQVTVQRPSDIQAALNAVQRSYGLVPWTGDPTIVERVALDAEFSIRESP